MSRKRTIDLVIIVEVLAMIPAFPLRNLNYEEKFWYGILAILTLVLIVMRIDLHFQDRLIKNNGN